MRIEVQTLTQLQECLNKPISLELQDQKSCLTKQFTAVLI